MSSLAQRGQGTTLSKTGSLYHIAEITKIGAFGAKRNMIDVTSHDTAGNADDWISGLLQGGDLKITANMIHTDTSGQVQAVSDMLAGNKTSYTITLPTGSTWVATMTCEEYQVTSDLKNTITIDLSFKVSGVPVWTP
jgi:hypothetical protein